MSEEQDGRGGKGEDEDARVLIHLVASISVRASPRRIVNLLLRSCVRRADRVCQWDSTAAGRGGTERTMTFLSSCVSSWLVSSFRAFISSCVRVRN